MTPREERPSVRLYRLIDGYQVSQAIHVAATLGVADHLRHGPRSAPALAAILTVDAPALYRLLRALAAVGVFCEDEQGSFSLTEMGACLCSDAPESLRDRAAYIGRPADWAVWAHLLDSVQSGQPAFPQLHQGQSIWEWRAAHPEDNTFFNRAQHAQTQLAAHALLAAYDFGQFPTVADLGGGSGAFLAALLARYPRMRGLLFDQPHVVAEAAPALERAGVAARCAVRGGSFFDAVPPGYAAYLLKAVLNSFDDPTRLAILRQVRSVCTADTRLLVLEYVVGPPNEDLYTKLLDLAMLLRTGGEQHTRDAWAALFAAGGFRLARITPSPLGPCVLEGVPV
jgi:O-methyltransferase/methyltransferase family protein